MTDRRYAGLDALLGEEVGSGLRIMLGPIVCAPDEIRKWKALWTTPTPTHPRDTENSSITYNRIQDIESGLSTGISADETYVEALPRIREWKQLVQTAVFSANPPTPSS